MDTVQLSIITVHLNDFEGLGATFRSIEALLSDPLVEWIVVDGGSHFQSSAQQQLLADIKATATVFVSAPDQGTYDGMNVGTSRANGAYILYLNSGDRLHGGFCLEKLNSEIGGRKPGMIWGVCYDLDRDGRVYKRKTRSPRALRFGMNAAHQAIFFASDCLPTPPYDLKYAIYADYDLLCRLYKSGVEIVRVSMPVCVYDLCGLSSDNKSVAVREEAMIRETHFGGSAIISPILKYLKLFMWSVHGRFGWVRRSWRKWI